MDIRPFHPDDTDAVIQLWQACDLTRPWNDPRQDIVRKLEIQPEWFLVVEDVAGIVGTVMAGYEGHRGWINYLAVAPEHRRQGVGRRLMKHAEQRLREAGCPKINLQIRETNRAVAAFYRAIGYSVDEVVSMGKHLVADESVADHDQGESYGQA